MVSEEQVVPSSCVLKLDDMEDDVQKPSKEIRLNLHHNPLTIFYKDEGGKSNYLTASCKVSLHDFDSHKSQIPIGNLKVTPRLVYECGGEIEDEEEIFNVLSVEPKTITSINEVFTVNFRIEKVSRRKDGKRFRVRFDFNEKKSNLLDYIETKNMEAVTTTAVTVLSKRKSHQLAAAQIPVASGRFGMSGEGSEEMKAETRHIKEKDRTKKRKSSTCASVKWSNTEETVTLPVTFLMKLRENMENLESTVNILSRRVAILEELQNKGDGTSRQGGDSFARGKRVHSLMFDEAFPNRNRVDTPSSLGFTGTNNNSIKRNGSSTHELFEFLSSSSFLN